MDLTGPAFNILNLPDHTDIPEMTDAADVPKNAADTPESAHLPDENAENADVPDIALPIVQHKMDLTGPSFI